MDCLIVFKLFRMIKGPHLYSFGTIIRACAGLGAVRHGKEVHCKYIRKGGRGHVIVESALVDLYAKCGLIDYAHTLFVQMPVRNLISCPKFDILELNDMRLCAKWPGS